MRKKRKTSIALAVGAIAGCMMFGTFTNIGTGRTMVHAEETAAAVKNEVTAMLCSSNGAIDSVNRAIELETGKDGVMTFTPVATGMNKNGKYLYSGTISATFCVVTPDENNFYKMSFQNRFGETLTYAIYDASLNKVTSFTITSGSNTDLTKKLNPNTLYYIIVSGSNKELNTGFSIVKINKIKDDAGDTAGKAKEVALDETCTGNLESEGDVDYFKVKTSDQKAFYRLTGWGVSTDSVKVSLYDKNNKLISSVSPKAGESVSSEIALKKNTSYYVEVHGGTKTTGKYKFRLTCKPDEVSDVRKGATKLEVGTPIKGNSIQTALDQDVYKINTGKHTALCLKVNNNSKSYKVVAYVTDADGTIVKSSTTVASQQSAVFELTKLDKKSNYYLVVKGVDGDAKYSVSAKTIKRSISYVVNDGKLGKGSPKSYIVSEKKKLVAPTRKGYTFDGWYTSASFYSTTKCTSVPETATTDLTLYAKWIKK